MIARGRGGIINITTSAAYIIELTANAGDSRAAEIEKNDLNVIRLRR
jgi:hypothetical protein